MIDDKILLKDLGDKVEKEIYDYLEYECTVEAVKEWQMPYYAITREEGSVTISGPDEYIIENIMMRGGW